MLNYIFSRHYYKNTCSKNRVLFSIKVYCSTLSLGKNCRKDKIKEDQKATYGSGLKKVLVLSNFEYDSRQRNGNICS